MGAIFPDEVHPCSRCGNSVKVEGTKAETFDSTTLECVVCKSLGDRAIVPLLRTKPGAERDAALEKFRASPPGSVLFNVGLMRRGVPQYGMDVHTFNPKRK